MTTKPPSAEKHIRDFDTNALLFDGNDRMEIIVKYSNGINKGHTRKRGFKILKLTTTPLTVIKRRLAKSSEC